MPGINRLSANENARYIARIYGLDPDYVSAFCRWLCDIDEYFDRPVGVYSSGMRSRAGPNTCAPVSARNSATPPV